MWREGEEKRKREIKRAQKKKKEFTHIAARVEVRAEPNPAATRRHEVDFRGNGRVLRRAVNVELEKPAVVRGSGRCRDHCLRGDGGEAAGGGEEGQRGKSPCAALIDPCCAGCAVFSLRAL